jgi:glycerol kinase
VSAPYILALDAGTTGNRAFLFDDRMRIVRQAYRELPVSFPRPGWVEQDACQIRDGCLAVLRETIRDVDPAAILALGVTNQRETVVVWDRRTGEPLAPAIVWQDRRTAAFCDELKARGLAPGIRAKTGLPPDPYFSASKLRWIRNHFPTPQSCAVGTVDSWLVWNLTGGKRHTTDLSNASRTMLCDIRAANWDDELCELFDVPRAMLPDITPTGGDLGVCDRSVLGSSLPIRAVVGDQQGALFGHGCFSPGDTKATFGTGLFLMANAGTAVPDCADLLATVAWRIGDETTYAIEGSAFTAGAALQWLRDGLAILSTVAESESAAESVADNGDVYFAPALSGLGTPHWDTGARGLFIGLTRGSTRAHLVRAVLEAIAYQTRELLELLPGAVENERGTLRVDGGGAGNTFLMRFLSEVLAAPISRPDMTELTAAGAAGIAGIVSGLWPSAASFAGLLGARRVFEPAAGVHRNVEYARWKEAVSRSRQWA